MLTMPSFKKSLIVEQFQGNYLKPGFFMLSVLPTGYIGVIRGIFAGSAFLWITGSLMSKSKLKLQ